MHFSRLLVIFFVFNTQLLAQDPNAQLMEAIKEGNKAGVKKSLGLGADINYVDHKTSDTPSFYSVQCALETIIFADGYIYGMYDTKKIKMYYFACVLACLPIMIGTLLITEKTGWFKIADCPLFAPAISLGTSFLLSRLPMIHASRSLVERIEIVTYLLKHENLNKEYRHSIYKKTISEFLDFLMIQRNAGDIGIYVYRDGRQFGDAIYSYPAVWLQLSQETAISLKTYTERLVPALKTIKDALKDR